MELNHFGWNAMTVSFIATVILTMSRAWAVMHQNSNVWRERSGKSVPVSVYVSSLFSLIATLIYGISESKVALIINGGTLFPLHIPILIGLWRYKGLALREKALAVVMIAMIGLMLVSPSKGGFYLVLAGTSVLMFIEQPWLIWANQSRGVVSIKFLSVSLISSCFWTMYSFAVNDLPLKIICISFFFIALVAVLLWLRYNEDELKRVVA